VREKSEAKIEREKHKENRDKKTEKQTDTRGPLFKSNHQQTSDHFSNFNSQKRQK